MTRVAFCQKDLYHIGPILESGCIANGCKMLVYVCEQDERNINIKYRCNAISFEAG